MNFEETNPEETKAEEATPEVITQPETAPKAARTRSANAATPSAEQLAASRAAHWHQDGNALLSIETLRAWVQRSGLVLYAPKPQLGAPAPTLVEATLGKPNATPELAELDAAKNLTARLIAEGNAVPLNLLGVTGANGTDVPDFVVSAAVFSYIFTLRGNKAWKQSPVTSGAVKVSPLALAAYELLTQKVTMSAYDMATQLGNGVTEGAVLRALTELWSQLRVLPVPQVDGAGGNEGTLWELATGRFTKQIKAGANAGQPSALSALISLYLAQAIVATEDEIESFLSPLAPRSRVRDVVHALMGARQLETLVIDGKTLLHVGGELPAFAAIASPEVAAVEVAGEGAGEEGGSRIKKFAAKPGSKIGTGLRAKPSFGSKPGFGGKPAFGARSAFGDRPKFGNRASSGSRPGFGAKPGFGEGDRERRPFQKDGGFAKPAFDKPWQEDRKPRPAASGPSAGAEGASGDGEFRPARTFERRPAGDRPAFGRKPYGDRGADRGAEGRPPRREFAPREGFTPREGSGGPRKTFSKPGTFGRKREGGFAPREGAEGRPPRREFAAGTERSERPAGGGFKRPGSYSPRPSASGYGGSSAGPRAGFSTDRGERGAEGGEAPRKVFRKFDAPRGPKTFGSKPSFGPKKFEGAGERSERPKRTFDGPRPERSERPGTQGRPSFGAKPAGAGGKKPFSKSSGFAAKGGPFAKFADGKKPFRKPGAPKKAAGGFKPTSRKRDGDGQ